MRLPADLASKIKILARRLNMKEEDIIIFCLKQHVELLETTYKQVRLKDKKVKSLIKH